MSTRGDVEGFSLGSGWVVGLDEVGAGCLAGPLYVVAFAFPVEAANEIQLPVRITDSKKLNPEKRKEAALLLRKIPGCIFKTLVFNVAEIEEVNIYWARMKAFWSLILDLDQQLAGKAQYIVDGPKLGKKHHVTPSIDALEMIELEKRIFAQSKADSSFFAVAAASILAKVTRDDFMKELGESFSHYNWEKNKGYATPDHIAAIREHGICPHHRKSFCGNFISSEKTI
ncbi:MAG: ribonuclease HII [Bdellovibrionota bacterium]